LALHESGADGAVNDGADADKELMDTEAVCKAQADAIFEIISDLKEAGALAKRQLNLDLVASTLRSRYDVDSDEYAQDLISARAGPVLGLMDNLKASGFDWSRKAIYRDLRHAAEKGQVQHVAITPLRPRTSLDEDSSEHESEDEDHPKARRRRVRKSVLRPKLTSVSTKKAGKKTRSAAQDMDTSEDSEAGEDLETPSKSRGHELVREPPSTVHINGRARSILSETDSLAIRKTPLQESLQSANVSSRENTDNLPDDTWLCSVQGCGRVVHKASSKRSKDLIHDHTLTHAEDTQTKVDLVFAEHRLNINIGVEHLLGRIREFGSIDGITAAGDTATKRVRR
jgi:hypothetical protein